MYYNALIADSAEVYRMDAALGRAFEQGLVRCGYCHRPTTECGCWDPCGHCGLPQHECNWVNLEDSSPDEREWASYKHYGCPKYWA